MGANVSPEEVMAGYYEVWGAPGAEPAYDGQCDVDRPELDVVGRLGIGLVEHVGSAVDATYFMAVLGGLKQEAIAFFRKIF